MIFLYVAMGWALVKLWLGGSDFNQTWELKEVNIFQHQAFINKIKFVMLTT